ncbi:zinc finger protein 862-like [Haliotis rubra]|uniref:zinc finger protein 862-like n=1 Tax=Haliotis rubra TaxID=36100 RepID=UPI001EE57516|nr:zinc finger protein 862-like [Haliotis rubra]
MGKRTGVGKQMQAKYSPFCIQTHCVAHRLNLACIDSIKKIEFMVKFRDKFNSLYNFISASSRRILALRRIQTLLEEPELTIKEPHSIRWLGLKNAVEAVFESFESVLSTLSKFAAEKNAVAKGLYKYFASYKVALVIAFLLDVHTELAVLSCSLQKKNLLFSELRPLIEGTLNKVDTMKAHDGQSLKEMKTRIETKNEETFVGGEKLLFAKTMNGQFETLRAEYLKNLMKNIKNRFKEEDTAIFTDMSMALKPLTVNTVFGEESGDAVAHLGALYGAQEEVKVIEGDLHQGLEEHIKLVGPLLQPDKLLDEWPRLKGMINGTYSKLLPEQLCKRVILLHKDSMPNCAKLASIALCMQLTSVECERSFSTQNRLKNKFRASLGSEKLDLLLKLSMLGPSLQSFDSRPAIKHWLRKRRRKGRLFCDYQPRPPKLAKTCDTE